jgi:hypothetical protein
LAGNAFLAVNGPFECVIGGLRRYFYLFGFELSLVELHFSFCRKPSILAGMLLFIVDLIYFSQHQ